MFQAPAECVYTPDLRGWKIVDLHYLSIELAVEMCKAHINYCKEKKYNSDIEVITGRGLHSYERKSDGGYVKMYATEFYKFMQIPVREHPYNKGRIIITIDFS